MNKCLFSMAGTIIMQKTRVSLMNILEICEVF